MDYQQEDVLEFGKCKKRGDGLRKKQENENIFGYIRLGEAVILQAAEDYLRALRLLDKHPRDSKAQYTVKECEDFFRNRMGMFTISEIDGEAIIKAVRRRIKTGGRIRRAKQ